MHPCDSNGYANHSLKTEPMYWCRYRPPRCTYRRKATFHHSLGHLKLNPGYRSTLLLSGAVGRKKLICIILLMDTRNGLIGKSPSKFIEYQSLLPKSEGFPGQKAGTTNIVPRSIGGDRKRGYNFGWPYGPMAQYQYLQRFH